MSYIELGSNATVIKPGTIKIVSLANPETILINALVPYLKDTGYADEYPNFSSVNVGTVHPFALLMFQDIQGEQYDMTVFPSVTIADNTLSEESDVLTDERSDILIEAVHVGGFKTMKADGRLFISDAGMTALENGTANNGKVAAVRRIITRRHTIGFSIWSDNRDVTSLLFELTTGFLLDQKTTLKQNGLEIREVSGSRTGDLNMDFGRILYGATLVVPGITTQTVATADVDIGIVTDVTVTVDPNSAVGQVASMNTEVTVE